MRFLYFVLMFLAAGLCGSVVSADSVELTATAKPAVVFIRHRNILNEVCTGSGFLISSDGHILTCAHVVQPVSPAQMARIPSKQPPIADRTWVRLPDGKTFNASIVYRDNSLDVAVLAIEAGGLPYLSLSPRDPVQGAEVLLLGYPLGQTLGKEMVVTRGIVSAIRANGSALQLDAAANPGNSGGPAIDSDGKVVGIAWAKMPAYEGTNLPISAEALQTALREANDEQALFEALQSSDSAGQVAFNERTPRLVNGKNSDGESPLDLAAGLGDVSTVALLVGMGADTNARDSRAATPLHSAAMRCILCEDERGMKSTQVAQILLHGGADVNARDEDGDTPLITLAAVAFAEGDGTEMAKLLIGNGADANARNNRGDTPLTAAASASFRNGDYVGLAKILISAGAVVQAKDHDGLAALDYARTRHNALLADVIMKAAHHSPKHGK